MASRKKSASSGKRPGEVSGNFGSGRGPAVTVVFEGGDDLRRALKEASAQFRRESRHEFEAIGQGVAQRAREIADEKHLRKSGRLINSIFSEVKGLRVVIGDDAVNPRDGYLYPGRLEYGDLDKPFLQPALHDYETQGLLRLTTLMLRVLETVGRGPNP